MSNDAGDECQHTEQKLSCPICQCPYFSKSQTLLSTKGANFFGLDWTNPSADIYLCAQCSFILWFLPTIDGEEEEVDIGSQMLTCTLCSHTGFWSRETLLSDKASTFLGFDW